MQSWTGFSLAGSDSRPSSRAHLMSSEWEDGVGVGVSLGRGVGLSRQGVLDVRTSGAALPHLYLWGAARHQVGAAHKLRRQESTKTLVSSKPANRGCSVCANCYTVRFYHCGKYLTSPVSPYHCCIPSQHDREGESSHGYSLNIHITYSISDISREVQCMSQEEKRPLLDFLRLV